MRRARCRTVLREWGRLGLIGFGGPPAHVALLRELVVERRGWIDAREFEDANAACQLLPGPASTQLAIYCAQRVGGLRGALVGGLGFIVPGLLMVLAIAALALGDAPPELDPRRSARAPARRSSRSSSQAGIALGRAALAGRRDLRAPAYIAAGLRGHGARRPVRRDRAARARACWSSPGAAARDAALHAWPVVLAAAAALPGLAWTALKVGALSYGGGFVIIPLMQEDAVERHGWMTETEFLDAVAFGQLTPGPVAHTVALVGWAAAGLGGALLAAAIAFAPSFLAIAPRRRALRAAARQPRRARVPRRRRPGRRRRDPRRGGAARARSGSGGRPSCWPPPPRCSRSAARRSGRWAAARWRGSRSPSPVARCHGSSRWTCRKRRPTSSRG